jgi:hypothetical protein
MRQNVALHNKSWLRPEAKRLKHRPDIREGIKKALRDCNNVPQSLVSVRPGKPDGGSLNPGTVQLFSKENRSDLRFTQFRGKQIAASPGIAPTVSGSCPRPENRT